MSVCMHVCVSVCPPRPMDGFTSYLVERCTSYPGYTWTTFRDLGSKVKVTTEVKVTVANTLKNQLCATHSFNSSFWRYWRVEQLLYKNLWSKINTFHTNQDFPTSTVKKNQFLYFTSIYSTRIHFVKSTEIRNSVLVTQYYSKA